MYGSMGLPEDSIRYHATLGNRLGHGKRGLSIARALSRSWSRRKPRVCSWMRNGVVGKTRIWPSLCLQAPLREPYPSPPDWQRSPPNVDAVPLVSCECGTGLRRYDQLVCRCTSPAPGLQRGGHELLKVPLKEKVARYSLTSLVLGDSGRLGCAMGRSPIRIVIVRHGRFRFGSGRD